MSRHRRVRRGPAGRLAAHASTPGTPTRPTDRAEPPSRERGAGLARGRPVPARRRAVPLAFCATAAALACCSRCEPARTREPSAEPPPLEAVFDRPDAQRSPGLDAEASHDLAPGADLDASAFAARDAPEDGSASTRSAVLWSADLDHAAAVLEVTSAGRIVVADERRVTALDERGRALWHLNVAPGDRVVGLGGECLHLREAQGPGLVAVDGAGRTRWQRTVRGEAWTLANGSLLAIEAAAARAISCSGGRDEWLFAPDRLRGLRLLAATRDRIVLLGERAEQRSLFVLDDAGRTLREVRLPAGTRAAVEAGEGQVVAWSNEELSLVGRSGTVAWSRPLQADSEVAVLGDLVAVTATGGDGSVETRVLDLAGRTLHACTEALATEAFSVRVLRGLGRAALVAACTGPLRACTEGGNPASGYNRLWVCAERGAPLEVLGYREEAYFDLVGPESGPAVLAESSPSGSTLVSTVDGAGGRNVLVELPGRRMIGPRPGPGEAWLVATCEGRACQGPFRLFAVSVAAEP